MNSKLTQNQDLLLHILKISLYKYPKNINPQDAKNIGLFYKNLLKDSSVYKKLINADWNQLISSADKHGVLSVMYEVLSQVNSICDYNKITDNSAFYQFFIDGAVFKQFFVKQGCIFCVLRVNIFTDIYIMRFLKYVKANPGFELIYCSLAICSPLFFNSLFNLSSRNLNSLNLKFIIKYNICKTKNKFQPQ